MDPEYKALLEEQHKKIDAIYVSVEKTRKYFLTTMWISLIAFLLPLIGILFALPTLFSTFSAGLY